MDEPKDQLADSDDDKSLIQFIQLKKKKTVLKKLEVVKVANPVLGENEPESAPEKKSKEKQAQYKCSDCEKIGVTRIFKHKESLLTHIMSKHGEDSKKLLFVCDVCSAAQKPHIFSAKKPFLAHMMIQHSMVVFICDICSAIFKLKANYKAHVITHNVPPKREFKCDICNGAFVNKAGYVAHRKRFPGPHIKQICPHCGASFSREKHMQNHRCKTLLLREAKEKAQERLDQEKEDAAFVEQIKYQPVEVSVANPLTMQGGEPEQLIIRDLSGNIVPGAQVLHIEISDSEQTQQVYQVNVADWNMVAPFVVRDQMASMKAENSTSN